MVVYITGVSKGIGQEIAKQFLQKGITVVGIGRNNSLQHTKYTFLQCDLNSSEEINQLHLEVPIGKEIIWINNAGILGSLKRVSQQTNSDALEVMQVNAIAPMLFMKKIIDLCQPENKLKIINISSGAGRKSIPSWSSYCASKAALDMFSETILKEEKELRKNTKIVSVAPGVIDTDMQAQIRSTNPEDFSRLEEFQLMKSNNELKTSEETATQIVKLALDKMNIVNDCLIRL
jgi:benzil reductase ((S)-benzoin forming)